MKFKSVSIPGPSKGSRTSAEKLVVPNQSMSLLEILTRFTRGEQLPVGKDVVYHESDEDIEKLKHMDLVDRAEYIEKLEQTKKTYEKQERDKEKAEREKIRKSLEESERQRLELEKKLAATPPKTDS